MDILITQPYLTYEILIFIFFILSAFFSGTETSLLSADKLLIEAWASKGKSNSKRALYLLENLEDTIGMILIGNNIANIAATVFLAYIFKEAFTYNNEQLIVVGLVQSMVFLVFCELIPKLIGRARASRFLVVFSVPILFFLFVFKPVIKIAMYFTRMITVLFKFQEKESTLAISREEIDILFRIGKTEGAIDHDHQMYVSEILSFKEIVAKEIMTPLIDIKSIELNDSIKNIVSLMFETKYSRIPVYEERVDNITGHVFYRDIVTNKKVKKILDVMTRACYVPATKNIYQLYIEMQKEQRFLVFVVNEYGAVEGMVTLEDIAEELVGEIETRDHSNVDLIKQVSDKEFLIDGNLDIEYFKRYFQVEFEKKGFETLAGFISFLMGKIPRKGESIKYASCTFVIQEATERSIETVHLKLRKKL